MCEFTLGLNLQGCEAGHAHPLLRSGGVEGDSPELLGSLLGVAEVQLHQVFGHTKPRQPPWQPPRSLSGGTQATAQVVTNLVTGTNDIHTQQLPGWGVVGGGGVGPATAS